MPEEFASLIQYRLDAPGTRGTSTALPSTLSLLLLIAAPNWHDAFTASIESNMLAAKPSFAGSASTAGLANNTMQSGLPTSRRIPNLANAPPHNFTSPTESEFSEPDGPDAVKNWDEDRVCEYLASVKCGEYEKLFRKNHINGDNLLEMDKEVLKEMGIDKVGDRVRLFLCIKKLRTRAYSQKRRNRVSLYPLRTPCSP